MHSVDFALDSMRRTCHGIEVLSGPVTMEARARIADLLEDVQALQAMSPRKVTASNTQRDQWHCVGFAFVIGSTCEVPEVTLMDGQLQRVSASLKRLHSHTNPMAFRRWGSKRATTSLQPVEIELEGKAEPASDQGRLPWGLVFAVAIDAAVDGMLIGLSTSTSIGAGMLMAIATVIEMGFLGYSFGCEVTCVKRNASMLTAVLALPPLCLIGFGVGAYAIGEVLQGCFIFTGLISFSLVAVLFLVIQELILEAAEKSGGENWNVSVFIYVGLLISFGLEIVL